QRGLEERLRTNGVWVPRGPGAAWQGGSQSAAPRREPTVSEAFHSAVRGLLWAGGSGWKTPRKNPTEISLGFRRVSGPAVFGIQPQSKSKATATARRGPGNSVRAHPHLCRDRDRLGDHLGPGENDLHPRQAQPVFGIPQRLRGQCSPWRLEHVL